MSEFRMKRVNELVKQELSKLIRKYLPVEDYGLVTVTAVEVAKDLKTAHVFISSVGNDASRSSALQALADIRKDLQYELSRKVTIKYTPLLIFKEDQGLERGQHVLEILEALDRENDKDGQKT